MSQFNGKQEGEADASQPNLRCPRNGKWTNLADSASITATERYEHALGKAMEVVPPARIPANKVVARVRAAVTAQAPSGTTVRVF
jgi:hypothetical protein